MPLRLEIRSCRISYKGSDKLDVTVQSGRGIGRELAPSWELVRGFKSGKLSWEEYKVGYLEILRNVWQKKRWVFRRLFNRGRVTFVCYCTSDAQCHRRLLREVVVTIGKRYGPEIVDDGELEVKN